MAQVSARADPQGAAGQPAGAAQTEGQPQDRPHRAPRHSRQPAGGGAGGAGKAGSAARERRQAILRLLASENEAVDVSYIYASSGGSSADLQDLYKKGLISYGEEEVLRDPLAGRAAAPTRAPVLTKEQQAAWARIQTAMQAPKAAQLILLHGVTGSGKTELYMRAIERTLAQGKQAIVLVPEISLTPQTIERFSARFGRQVGVVHSKLSPGERYDTWRRAREADFSIAIGPRSARSPHFLTWV